MIRSRIALFVFLILTVSSGAQNAVDSLKFGQFLNFAESGNLARDAPGERVGRIARYFLGTPYEGATLEVPGLESVQCNLRAFDCTTFVENVLAFSLLLEQDAQNLDDFRNILENIRYQGGLCDGFASRLHYSTDWLRDNVGRALFDWVDANDLQQIFKPHVNYMSQHPAAYPSLKADSSIIPFIARREKLINSWNFIPYVPKERVSDQAEWIRTGDVIVITTNTPGLDYSHMGIAIRQKGKVYLLHASSSTKMVVLTKETLREYLAGVKKHTGITVVRPH